MFERFEHISPKTKILFAVILLILLPSAFLSYFGLQSIDQKAENLRTNYRASLTLVRDKMEREIVRLEENLRNSLISFPPQKFNAEGLKAWLQRLESENPAVKYPFLLNADGGIISTLLSLAWKQSQQFLQSQVLKVASVQQAEEAEFIRKDVAEAINLYRQALYATSNPSDRALILSRLGRCYYKLGRHQEGIKAYGEILTLHSSEIKIGTVPASAVALLQIVDGYEALAHQQKRLETLTKLYRQLINVPWELDDGSYLYYLRFVGNAVRAEQKVLESDLQETRKREELLLEQAARLQLLQQEVIPVVTSNLKRGSLTELQLQQVSFGKRELRSQFGYFKLPPAFEQAGLVVLGYEMRKGFVLSDVLPKVLQSIDLGSELTVGIINERDSILFTQDKALVSRYLVAEDFGESMVGWKVALFDRAGKSLEEHIAGEKRLYVMLLVGIILVMALGIVVTVRAAVHETEVARIKADFVANVSHELKTPLALIRMFGETLEAGIVKDEMKRKEFYSIIRKESERLTHLINNVLDFSKMDAGSKVYNFEETDLVEVVRSTLEAYKFHMRDLGFEVESHFPSGPIFARIDKDAISQALLNLLSNATNYSEDRKYISVEVAQNAHSVRISVVDQGVGIPKKEVNKVLEKFYRASTMKTKETRGAGLGLTLVKHIVEAHQGAIEVESEEGRGSVFTLSIPLRHEV